MAQRANLAALLIWPILFATFADLQADDDYQAKEALWLTDHAHLVKKLETLVIGDVDFKNATADEVLDFIRSNSKAADPDHLGINIMADTNCLFILRSRTYDMHLKRATIRDVINQLHALLRVSAGDFIVKLSMPGDEEMWERVYPVADNTLAINESMLIDKDKLIYNVRPLFETKGIKFPSGTCAIYDLPNKKLIIRAINEETLIRIDEILIFGFKTIK